MKGFLDWIRRKRCCICQMATYHDEVGEWLCDVSHLRHRGMGGNKKMEHEGLVVPMCRNCHTRFHMLGMTAFQDHYDIDLWPIARELSLEWKILKAREEMNAR